MVANMDIGQIQGKKNVEELKFFSCRHSKQVNEIEDADPLQGVLEGYLLLVALNLHLPSLQNNAHLV